MIVSKNLRVFTIHLVCRNKHLNSEPAKKFQFKHMHYVNDKSCEKMIIKIHGFYLTANTTNKLDSQPIKKAHVETHVGTTQVTTITKLSEFKYNNNNNNSISNSTKNNNNAISNSTKTKNEPKEHLTFTKGTN